MSEKYFDDLIEADELEHYLTYSYDIPPQMMYLVGRHFSEDTIQYEYTPARRNFLQRIDFCVLIYRDTWITAHDAVVCWLLCGQLIKDVRVLIGKLVWESRKDPEDWKETKPRIKYSDKWWNGKN